MTHSCFSRLLRDRRQWGNQQEFVKVEDSSQLPQQGLVAIQLSSVAIATTTLFRIAITYTEPL
jgi:hypothetical protein